jgi:hypothetical protein
MATPFRLDLVLNVKPSCPFTNHFTHGSRWIVPARIRIHEQRKFGCIRDPSHINEHVVKGCQANVRDAITGIGHSRAGKVERPESGIFSENRSIRVNHTGDL